MLPAPLPSRRIAALTGGDLYRAHVRRAAAIGFEPDRVWTTDPQLARCGTELEAVVWFWWRIAGSHDARIVLRTHPIVYAAGRLCPIDLAFELLDGETSRPGVALFLDDPLDRRGPRADRSSALQAGGWTVLRVSRDAITRNPLDCIRPVGERLEALLAALTEPICR
jgi:hypothetical protein